VITVIVGDAPMPSFTNRFQIVEIKIRSRLKWVPHRLLLDEHIVVIHKFARNGSSHLRLQSVLGFDVRIWGKNLGEDKSKVFAYMAIELREALSGA
jgi:hypothetical protein